MTQALPLPAIPSTHCGACAVCQNNLIGQADRWAADTGGSPCQQVEYAAGAVIYAQGLAGETLYSVCHGVVKLEQLAPDASPRTVRLLHGGCVFGLELLAHEPYHHRAVALGRVRVCRIPAGLIDHLAHHSPELHDGLMRQWQLALDEADFVIARLSTGPARQRVAHLLVHLCQAGGDGQCPSIPRDDMASLLGLTPETTSRTVAMLKREGVVQEEAGQFLCDVRWLQLIAAGTEPDQPSLQAQSAP